MNWKDRLASVLLLVFAPALILIYAYGWLLCRGNAPVTVKVETRRNLNGEISYVALEPVPDD